MQLRPNYSAQTKHFMEFPQFLYTLYVAQEACTKLQRKSGKITFKRCLILHAQPEITEKTPRFSKQHVADTPGKLCRISR